MYSGNKIDINKSSNWQYPSVEIQKKYRQTLERTDKNKILSQLPALHKKAFENIDCLTCANCCRNFSPRIKTPDLKRIAKYLNMKEGAFVEKYLFLDEDGDYVVNAKPCPFLGHDNYCTIYEVRPSDCKRFPYTNEDVIIKRKNITIKNSSFCPIVSFVLDGLGK